MEAASRIAACGKKSVGCSEDGQGMVEYAFILFLVSIAVFGALGLLGDELENLYARIVTQWPA